MIPCLITARLTSERMPKKHLLQLGPQTVIEHVVRRCEHFGFKPYVCVPLGEHTVGPPAVRTPREVFVYFDNDVKVCAPFDAIALAERVD